MAMPEPPVTGFAVAVVLEDGTWRCSSLNSSALDSLDASIKQLRTVATSGAEFAMLAVDDEFFIIVRPSPSGTELLLSDAGAALDYDIAADVMDMLGAETSDEDDGVWPEGDSAILADLGLPPEELEMIASDVDLYPDEQLRMIAARCGFVDEFDKVAPKL